MIVVDASVLLAFFLREKGWRKLSNYMIRTVSIDHAIKEFYNGVWKALALRKRIDEEDASKVLELFNAYIKKNIILEDEADYIDDAYKISLEYNITIYDSLYLAQARRKKLPILTLDRKQIEVAREIGLEVITT